MVTYRGSSPDSRWRDTASVIVNSVRILIISGQNIDASDWLHCDFDIQQDPNNHMM